MSMELLMLGELVLFVLVLGLGVLIFALVRQIGVLHERLAPLGAMVSDRGPAVGQAAPRIDAITTHGRIELGRPSASGRSRLLLFVSADCPICKQLIPTAKSFVRDERIDVLFIGDSDTADHDRLVERAGLRGHDVTNSTALGLAFHVSKLPYAVLLDSDGVVRAKGLVNSREHLESLVVAQESGFASIQDYLARAEVHA